METTGKKGLLQTLVERSKAETPPFFKKIRLAGLILTAIGSSLVAAPFMLPTVIVTVGTYLVVAGSMITAVSQVAIPEAKEQPEE